MIRVLIVDNALVDSALNEENSWTHNLARQPGISLIAAVTRLSEGLNWIEHCDIVLVSTGLPEDGAYHLTRCVTQHAAREAGCIQVILLGQNNPPASLLRYFEIGAMGYVSLDAEPEAIWQTIQSVYCGEAVLPPSLTTVLLGRLVDLAAWSGKMGFELEHARTLTRREHEILDLLARNYTNQDIADHLIIEVGTVKNHVHNILAKLKVSSRREAASYLALLRNSQPDSRHRLHVRRQDGYRRQTRAVSSLSMQDQA